MKNKPIVFRVDQGDYHAVFSLKQITVSDDSAFLRTMIDAADDDAGSYERNVEALASWAAPFPGDLKSNGKAVKRPDDALDTPEAVKAYFAEADVDKDWIAEYAVRSLRLRHSPQVSFF